MLLDNAWTEYDLAPLLRFPRALKHPFTPAIDSHSTVDWLAFRLNINRWLSRLLYSLKGVALSFVVDRSFAFDRTSYSNSATVPVQSNCEALTGWHDSSTDVSSYCGLDVSSCQLPLSNNVLLNCPVVEWLLLQGRLTTIQCETMTSCGAWPGLPR